MVIKIDLSKSYDRLRWLYLSLILLQVGFNLSFANWVMRSVTSFFFVILINGETSNFLRPKRGLRQGCSIFPLLFLLVAEGLSRGLYNAKLSGTLKGIRVGGPLHITNILFCR